MLVYRRVANRHLRNIALGDRERCWCGGGLLPFKWHASYGVCADCGCYVNRRPPVDLKQVYSSAYWHIVQKSLGFPAIETRGDLYRKDGRLAYWLGLVKRYAPPQGTVIEVGCAPGILLAELQAKGYQCVGAEADEDNAEWIRRNMKVDVRAGLFPGLDLPHCDLFLGFDVLEHSPNPDLFLDEVHRLLTPGGVAVLQTPIERYGYEPPFGEAFQISFSPYEHLFLFSTRAIEMLAKHSGLDIVNLDERLWIAGEICVLRKPRS